MYHSVHHLLITNHVPGTPLSVGNTKKSKNNLCPQGALFLMKETNTKIIRYCTYKPHAEQIKKVISKAKTLEARRP